MADLAHMDKKQASLYDVQLTRMPPKSLRARFPDMTVRMTQAQTALRQRVDAPEELDALLSEIGGVGLTLTDVHRVTTIVEHDEPGRGRSTRRAAGGRAPTGSAAYEVRVVGELGSPLLLHLGCAHYSVPEMVLVRIRLVAEELAGFLQACSDYGARLEQVRRVGSWPPAGSS